MSKSTISVYQLFELIPDAETARIYLEKRLWPDGATPWRRQYRADRRRS